MIKYWKIAATKDGKPVTLYTCTTDERIVADLKLNPSRSLIRSARHFHMREHTDDQNHIDLATGAFLHCGTAEIKGGTPIETADNLPDKEPVTNLGGDEKGFLMSIWIQDRT